MKSSKEKKVVTLPIAAEMIYDSLADIAWRVEAERLGYNKQNNAQYEEDKREYKNQILQELGADAFLFSFTPSGEIGSGDSDFKDNPKKGSGKKRSYGRISNGFYNSFIGDKEFRNAKIKDKKDKKHKSSREYHNYVFSKNTSYLGEKGLLTSIFSADGSNPVVVNRRLFKFKSAFVAFVQLYMECNMREYHGGGRVKTNGKRYDKDSRRIKGVKSVYNASNETSFSYRQKDKNESDEQYFEYLVHVEMNRYLRLFTATFFFIIMAELFATNIEQFARVIDANDLARINNVTNIRKRFARLKSSENRDSFVKSIQALFNLSINIERLPGVKDDVDKLPIFANDEEGDEDRPLTTREVKSQRASATTKDIEDSLFSKKKSKKKE